MKTHFGTHRAACGKAIKIRLTLTTNKAHVTCVHCLKGIAAAEQSGHVFAGTFNAPTTVDGVAVCESGARFTIPRPPKE